jgi:osmotically-inducible protein OsmY
MLVIALQGCGSIMASAGAGPIEEDPGERTLGQQMTDEGIETKAKVNINAASEGYDDAHLSIVSYNGFVLLVGQVSSQELKSLATDVVREIEDVRRIYNELEIGEATGAGTRTNDTWITTQVKSKLLASSDTPGRRVKVVTENSVVYLMGLLTEAEADRVALEAAEVSGTERVVQLFELIPAPAI